MNETDFLEKWEREKPIYQIWGNHVLDTISNALESKNKDLQIFLKVPAKSRLKDNASLIDKAFYRRGKNYSNPYNEIEDKVGVRFVVLLLEDIEDVCKIVTSHEEWSFDACKHFNDDREKDPLLFTYQSVHYILRPIKEMELAGQNIPVTTPCELQIRTLLQHAHAELTHDAIYKTKRAIKPKVQRTVAKSMALIETTDDFFSSVTQDLNHGPLQEYKIAHRLDELYKSSTGLEPYAQKSSLIIWDEYEQFIDKDLFDNIQKFLSLSKYECIPDMIKIRYSENPFYQQSIILFVYWMLTYKRRRLIADWPCDQGILKLLGNDLGVSTFDG